MDERIVENIDEAEKHVHVYVFEVLIQTDRYRRNTWKSQRKQEICFWTIKYFPDSGPRQAEAESLHICLDIFNVDVQQLHIILQ